MKQKISLKRGMTELSKAKKGVIAIILALVLAISVVPDFTNEGTPVTVMAASKDKKKPKFTFKGKTSMTVTKNKSVKIPKVTAKDNKDGNVTKKIKVTVKKGKKNYSSIAKKIKANKSVKFTSTGKYIVTYTVTDKAGNKATKKRTITVKSPSNSKTATTTEESTQKNTTETPTTEKVTTETPTTEQPTTEAPTTEQPTTEAPTTEQPTTETPTDYSQYDIKEVTYDGNTYKVTRDEDFVTVVQESDLYSTKINFSIDNEYVALYIDRKEEILTTSEYLKFLGSIKATDENGNDISDRIVIYEEELNKVTNGSYNNACIYIYAEDNNGNKAMKSFLIQFCNFDRDYANYVEEGYELISNDPIVFGQLRTKTTTLSQCGTVTVNEN